MESHFANINLEGDEDDKLILDDNNIQADETFVDLCLVGRFLTDQPINFNLMRSRMAGIWRPGKGVFMKDIGQGRYIFQFFHKIDLQRVAEGGPWSFNNIPLILHQLSKGEFPLRVPLDWVSFWIQIHDLPAGYILESIGKQLGNFIGKFLEYDSTNSTSTWRQYMQLRVAIDVTKPLKRGKRIKKPDGSSFVVSFKYERLHIFCFLCGRIGHSERFCENLFTQDASNTHREWGVWLKADDRRGLSLPGDKWIRSEGTMKVDADAAPAENPPRRGKEVFTFGRSGINGGVISNPRNSGSRPNHVMIDTAVSKERDTERDLGDGSSRANFMNKENDEIALVEERKRRRSESNLIAQPLSDVSNKVLSIEYTTNMDHTDSTFLSADSGMGVRREQ